MLSFTLPDWISSVKLRFAFVRPQSMPFCRFTAEAGIEFRLNWPFSNHSDSLESIDILT
jgi:hypothetical protein